MGITRPNISLGTKTLTIGDPLVELSSTTIATPVNDSGIIIERGTSDNAAILWDESRDEFVVGTTTATGDSEGDLTVTPGNISVERIGCGTEQAEAEVHAKRDVASGATYSTTAPIIIEDDARPAVQLVGSANNIGMIQFGDNAAAAAGQIYYDHSTDKFRIDTAGNTDQVTIDSSGSMTVANDLSLTSDSAVLNMGAGNDVTLTHDGTTGVTIAANPVHIIGGGASTWKTTAGAILIDAEASTATIDGHTGVSILSSNSGEVDITSAANLDINVTTTATIDAATSITITSPVQDFAASTSFDVACPAITFKSSGTQDPLFTLKNTGNNDDGAIMQFQQNGGEGTDDDIIGTIRFKGEDDGGATQLYADIVCDIANAAAGSEAGRLVFKVAENDGDYATGLMIAGSADADGVVNIVLGAGAASTTTIEGQLSLGDRNITNVGSIACDSVVVDAAAAGLDVVFGGNTTLNKLSLTDNLADALNITEGSNSYLKFTTTNSGEAITSGAGVELKNAYATQLAAGAGFVDAGGASAVTGHVKKENGTWLTTIKVDIQGLLSNGTNGIIGETTNGATGGTGITNAYLTKITAATNGYIYKVSMICTEVPSTGTAKINLVASPTGTHATKANATAGDGVEIIHANNVAWRKFASGDVGNILGNAGGDNPVLTLGMVDHWLYFTADDSTAGIYDAGRFTILLYGVDA